MKKILSIEGGGIKGLIPALLLTEIERCTGQPIARMFDLLAGTSTPAELRTRLEIANDDMDDAPG